MAVIAVNRDPAPLAVALGEDRSFTLNLKELGWINSLVGCSVEAQVRDGISDLIADLGCTIADEDEAIVTLTFSRNATTKYGRFYYDIRITKPSGQIQFTPVSTFSIKLASDRNSLPLVSAQAEDRSFVLMLKTPEGLTYDLTGCTVTGSVVDTLSNPIAILTITITDATDGIISAAIDRDDIALAGQYYYRIRVVNPDSTVRFAVVSNFDVRRSVTVGDGSSIELPDPPVGYLYLIGSDGAYLIGADGAYLIGVE